MKFGRIFLDSDGKLNGLAWVLFFSVLFVCLRTVLLGWVPRFGASGYFRVSWLFFAAALLATWISCSLARMRLSEAGLRPDRAAFRFTVGFGLGGLLFGLVAALPWLLGQTALVQANGNVRTLAAAGLGELFLFAPQSAAEELLVRGFALAQLRRYAGPRVAVLATGSIFSLLHLFNPAVSALGLLNIEIVGIFLGILVLHTGSIWLTVGLHTAWNWFQGFVWGFPVSGLRLGPSLLWPRSLAGSLASGGNFGPEASLYTTAVMLLALAGALRLWQQKKEGTGYFWKK